MAFLDLKNIDKNFGSVKALSNINLHINQGETVAIIGPSGCGKSTLLRCIGLFEEIDSGEIGFNNQRIIKRDEKQLITGDIKKYHTDVVMVFQHLHLWPHLNVLQNLTLAPKLALGYSDKEAEVKAEELLIKMGINDKSLKYPYTLSGGEKQRVAIARALMLNPKLLLLDEITSALDPEIVGEILEIIEELTKGGMTMLIVTHEMQFAKEVADRVIFMNNGVIDEQGDPQTIFNYPNSKRLKTFLSRLDKNI